MDTWGLCPQHIPAAPQKECEHVFPMQKDIFPSCHLSCLGLLLLIHLMKPSYFTSCCFFSYVVRPQSASLWAWMAGQTCVCLWGRSEYHLMHVCLLFVASVKMLSWGRRSLACISRLGFHQQKSIALCSAACSARGWGALDRLHASRICMLHEHNLLEPSGNSIHPFAMFLPIYMKGTNLQPQSIRFLIRILYAGHHREDSALCNVFISGWIWWRHRANTLQMLLVWLSILEDRTIQLHLDPAIPTACKVHAFR